MRTSRKVRYILEIIRDYVTKAEISILVIEKSDILSDGEISGW